MNHHYHYRSQYPDVEFETRHLHCADGLTRVVSLSMWFWEKLDLLLKDEGSRNIEEITRLCIKLEQREVEKDAGTGYVFFEVLMYYIWLNFNAYCQFYNGYANDNYDNFFTQTD